MRNQRIVVVILLLILSFFLFIFRKQISEFFIIGYLQNATSRIFENVYSLKTKSTKDELSKLLDENKKLREQIASLKETERDNKALRGQFETEGISSQKLLPAKVIGSVGSMSHPTTLIIDKGKSDGVAVGNTVVVEKSLVGKVIATTAGVSQVMLSINTHFETTGTTSTTNAIGIVRGEDDFVVFDKVSIADSLKAGDEVITKGDVDKNGLGIQKDIIIGKIVSINKLENQPFQTAKVQPILNFVKLDMVFVMTL